ncbi:hypothetical protein GCM10020331_007660 [Ectobacillus funiculus]
MSGEEYGDYLDMLAEHFELPVYEETDVKKSREHQRYIYNLNFSRNG